MSNPFDANRDTTAEPRYGEAQPIPEQPQMVQMHLPVYRDVAWKVLLGLIVMVYAVEVVRSGGFNPTDDVLLLLGAKSNSLIYNGHEYWRLFTPMFLHASVLHLLFNSYSLFAVGPTVERFLGTARFLGLYFISGLAGSVASYTFSRTDSVGASGAIFGLVGGLAAFFYVSRKTFGEMARQQLGSLLTVIMLNLFIGFGGGNIDNYAHIGGLLGGALLGWLLSPRLVVDDRLYPPQVVRSFLPFGWPGALAFLAALAALVLFVIVPPM